MPNSSVRKCYICRKDSGHRLYCPRHQKMMKKVHAEFTAHRDALRRNWSPADDCCLCEYTGVRLVEDDPQSPLHYSFDHVIPGKPGNIVMTFERLNSMKKDLSGDELRLAARLLYDHFAGAPFDKDAMQFHYFWRVIRPEDAGLIEGSSDPVSGYGLLPGERFVPCDICGFPAPSKAKYCARCNRWILHHPDKALRVAALKRAWDPVRKGFVCAITGVLLEEKDFHDPWYITFDHVVPGVGPLQVVASWVNGMKADLTVDGFKAFIRELARHFRTGEPFDVRVI